jgi:hypothetical protein
LLIDPTSSSFSDISVKSQAVYCATVDVKVDDNNSHDLQPKPQVLIRAYDPITHPQLKFKRQLLSICLLAYNSPLCGGVLLWLLMSRENLVPCRDKWDEQKQLLTSKEFA